MDQATWTRVDEYFDAALGPPDPILRAALDASDAAGLPPIHVSPQQGRFLELIARAIGARRILEVGTLAGYSTICLARALPPGAGRLVTLEIDPLHARVAAANIARAGLSAAVDIRVGPALVSLERLDAERAEPFDLVFIDADKPSNPAYFQWATRLARPGAVVIVDNVVRGGAVADPESTDPGVLGVRALARAVADHGGAASAMQTVGAKGYDGFLMAVVGA